MEFHSWYFSPSHETQRASVDADAVATHSVNELLSVQKDVEKKKNEFLGRLSRQPSISEREGSDESQSKATSLKAESHESGAHSGEKHAEDMCKALEWLTLRRDAHESYLLKSIRSLENTYESLDASQPWLIYWIMHAMHLLEIESETELQIDLVRYLEKCQNVRSSLDVGGFGGGPCQLSHLATTYGAINALCTIQSEYAYSIIDRPSLADWLASLRREDGAFRLHRDGEVDVRGAYCALVAATLTGIYHPNAAVTSTARSSTSASTSAAAPETAADDRGKQLFEKTAEWVASCQSFEGGFGGTPGLEAHGGYTFCALAALVLLNRTDLIDMRSLLRWLVHRQMRYEGGFQGRTNKLVDSCYSFWVGALFPLVHHVLSLRKDEALNRESWLFNRIALQEYVLVCCQRPRGGLLDKPGKPPDAYHTCYALSGLSVAQHFVASLLERKRHASDAFIIGGSDMSTNILSRTSPIFNVDPAAAERMMLHFRDMPIK